MTEGVPGFTSSSRYDDVWSRETEICPYCAYELAYEDESCPRCKRALIRWHFRYEKPGANLHILWVLLGGLGQLYLINASLDLVLDSGIPLFLLHGLLTLTFFGLTVAVYFRQAWAHMSTIVILLILLFLRVVNILGVVDRFLPDAADPVETLFVSPLMNLILTAVDSLQLAALVLALFWAVLFTGPDFEREKDRLRARLDRRLREASSYYIAGRRNARQGRWATAILHWQRAVAQAPTNRQYHRHLGQGYARLGFFERSQDVLETARDLTIDDEERAQVENLLTRVRRQRAGRPDETDGK